MKSVPWRYVHSWECILCGICCGPYVVSLTLKEWTRIVQTYGVRVTQPGIDGFYLKKNANGRCVFQIKLGDMWLCAIQHMKPRACKLWPFRIYLKPKHGRADEALYNYRGHRLFVYVDPLCRGLTWGRPGERLLHKTLPEVAEIKLGLREGQRYSTALLSYKPIITANPRVIKI
ncbi:MAG: YkgJ family cysteine cluster protein [Candidatus Bathyarchaeia archaeon]